MPLELTPAKALIFRIVHKDNIGWILDNGVHCPSSATRFDGYVHIGNADLIDKRSRRALPISIGGLLSDYAPFYFTPWSPMLLNIKSGRNGIRARANRDIAILVSSLKELAMQELPFIFSDRHAYLSAAIFSSDLRDLSSLDWPSWQARDFKRDPEHPERFERYQAEALVKKVLPTRALLAIGCFDDAAKAEISQAVTQRGLTVKTVKQPSWYF